MVRGRPRGFKEEPEEFKNRFQKIYYKNREQLNNERRKLYQLNKERGICVRCWRKPEKGVLCEVCKYKDRTRGKE